MKIKTSILAALLVFSQVTKTDSSCTKITSFPATIWNSTPIEVGRNFISITSNVLGSIVAFSGWAGFFLWDDFAKKHPNGPWLKNTTAETWFLKNNVYALGLFMLAATLKVKNEKKTKKTANLTL